MWLRWWHGSVTDPKFGWVARKSGQSVAVVIAVWAALLEHASQESGDITRGDVSRFDCEAIDVLLGVEDGVTASIVEAMNAKGLISDGRIAQWEKRQPKREDSSRDRMREHRAKQNNPDTAGDAHPSDVTQRDAAKNAVTQCDAREDKNRRDKNINQNQENIFPHSDDHPDTPEASGESAMSQPPPSRGKSSSLSPEERVQIEAWWDKFWTHYPRREDKKKAREAFDRILARASPEKRRLRIENISRRLNAYLDEIAKKGTEKEYIKYPARWLNAHDWDDSPESDSGEPPKPRMFEGLTPWTDGQATEGAAS